MQYCSRIVVEVVIGLKTYGSCCLGFWDVLGDCLYCYRPYSLCIITFSLMALCVVGRCVFCFLDIVRKLFVIKVVVVIM